MTSYAPLSFVCGVKFACSIQPDKKIPNLVSGPCRSRFCWAYRYPYILGFPCAIMRPTLLRSLSCSYSKLFKKYPAAFYFEMDINYIIGPKWESVNKDLIVFLVLIILFFRFQELIQFILVTISDAKQKMNWNVKFKIQLFVFSKFKWVKSSCFLELNIELFDYWLRLRILIPITTKRIDE